MQACKLGHVERADIVQTGAWSEAQRTLANRIPSERLLNVN
jgi:hypothetical protein